jgi:lysine-N-methylase
MEGIRWGPASTMEELASRYAEAQRQWYAPFMSQHEFMLDNFLSNYLARKLFPYGQRDSMENAVRQEYLLLVTHYATIRTLLVGMAAFHGAGFGAGQVVKLVQAYAKAFLHSTAYPEKALQILAGNGITTAEQALVLLQD